MHSRFFILLTWEAAITPYAGIVWAGGGQTCLPWHQEASPRTAQTSGRSSCHGDDAASSCSTLHHCKDGETQLKSAERLKPTVALKRTKLGQRCSLKHNMPDLCYTASMVLLQRSCHSSLISNAWRFPAAAALPFQCKWLGRTWELWLQALLDIVTWSLCE